MGMDGEENSRKSRFSGSGLQVLLWGLGAGPSPWQQLRTAWAAAGLGVSRLEK